MLEVPPAQLHAMRLFEALGPFTEDHITRIRRPVCIDMCTTLTKIDNALSVTVVNRRCNGDTHGTTLHEHRGA